MTLKETFKKLYDSDPRVQETIDKMFPNDHLVKEIVNGTNSGVQTNPQEGEEEKMAKFEKQESEYISGNDLVNAEGVRFEILTEVKEESSNFGIKPKCSVKVLKNGVTSEHKWTLNQQNVNYLIDNFGGESTAWIGKSVGVFVENIKGNNAIRVKA